MARQNAVVRWVLRPQVLLPILLVVFVAAWLTAFPLWYSRAPSEKTGAFGGWAWFVIDVGFVVLFGGAMAIAAVQWSRSRRKDYPKTGDQEVREQDHDSSRARQRS